jgi:hypothetical protein
MSPSSSGLKNKPGKKAAFLARNQALLAARFMPVSCLAYSSTLKMEATCSSGTSVDFQRTARRYIPEDRTLHGHRCESLESYRLHTYSLLNQCPFIETENSTHLITKHDSVHCPVSVQYSSHSRYFSPLDVF